MSVGMWRANGNPNPCTDLDEILHAYPPPIQGRFWYRFDPHPYHIRAWEGGLKP